MRIEELEEALRAAAERQPPVGCELGTVVARGRRRRRHAWAVSAAGLGFLLVLGASLTVWSNEPDDEAVRTSGRPPATGRWEQLPEPPLSPRARTVGVWTGDEVLLVGGDTQLCPVGANCIFPDDSVLSDGAALDPTSRTWRSIAPSPVPFSFASTAVLGDAVYFLLPEGAGPKPAAFLRYSLDRDTWTELPVPPCGECWGGLIAAGDVLVRFTITDELGEVPDQIFDPTTKRWSPLSPDPLSPSLDRTMVWAPPFIYLFEKQLAPPPGPERPITRVARLRPGSNVWERLPDSEIVSTTPWYAEGDLLINPELKWSHTYPHGGILDTATKTWTGLPEAPFGLSNGVVGKSGGLINGGHEGLLLDLTTMTWVHMPAIPGNDLSPDGSSDRWSDRPVVPAGRNAVSFGGERWIGDQGELLGDAWIWRTG